MSQKILSAVVVICLAIALVFGYMYISKKGQPKNNLHQYLPAHSSIVLEANQLQDLWLKLQETSLIWRDISTTFPEILKFNEQLKFLDSVFVKHLGFTAEHKAMKMALAIVKDENKPYNFIWAIPMSETSSKASLEKYVAENLENYFVLSLEANTKAEIFSISSKNALLPKLYLSLQNRAVVISSSIQTLENTLNEKNILANDSAFVQMNRLAGKSSSMNVFVNHSKFQGMIGNWLKNEYQSVSKKLIETGNWLALDLRTKPTFWQLNGFCSINTQKENYLKILRNQGNFDLGISDFIPSNTAFFWGMSFADPAAYKALAIKESKLLRIEVKLLEDTLGSFENNIYPWLGSQVAFLIRETTSRQYENKSIGICQLKDAEAFVKYAKIDAVYTESKSVFTMPHANLFQALVGGVFENFSCKYGVILGQYLITASTQEGIQDYLASYEAARVWSKDLNFEKLSENLSSKSQLFVYLSPAKSLELMPNFTEKTFTNFLLENSDFSKKTESICLQLSEENEQLFYLNLLLKYNPVFQSNSASLWEVTLDTVPHTPPIPVKNHENGSWEILIQDSLKQLYLLNNTGEIVWKKEFPEFIFPTCEQVDALKNNKLQVLLSGKKGIYLLDRNGNLMTGYPIKFDKSEITQPVKVFDYDKNKNYRILATLENGEVENYELSGKKTEGWKFKAMTAPVKLPLLHFVVQGKDYLCVVAADGSVKATGRDGAERLQFKQKITHATQIFSISGSQLAVAYILALDSVGNTQALFLNDKISKPYPLNEAVDYLVPVRNSKTDRWQWLYHKGRSLMMVEGNKILHEITTQGPLLNAPKHLKFKDEDYIFWLSENANEVHYKKGSGSGVVLSPFSGRGEYFVKDINLDGSPDVVIVKGKRQVLAYTL